MGDQELAGWASWLLVFAVSLALYGALMLAADAWRRWQQGVAWVDFEPHPIARWGLIDIVITGMVVMIGMTLVQTLLRSTLPANATPVDLKDIPPRTQLSWMFWLKVTELLGIVLAVAVIVWRTRTPAARFGWTRPTRHDFWLGLRCFGLLVIPIYSLMFCMRLILPEDLYEQQHPIIEMIKQDPEPQALLGTIFLLAVVMAPLSEEIFFRALMQGWFENLALAKRLQTWWLRLDDDRELNALSGLWRPSFARPALVEPLAEPLVERVEEASDVPVEEVGEETVEEVGKTGPPESSGIRADRPMVAPIVLSSLLFAVAHWGHALDPIPLFLLALGMGYLYASTGRVWPCIVMHGLNNGLSFLLMLLAVLSRQASP